MGSLQAIRSRLARVLVIKAEGAEGEDPIKKVGLWAVPAS